MSQLESIRYNDGHLHVLNQLKLPLETVYDEVNTVQDGWTVIREMRVRGAPAIAIVAALSLAVELRKRDFETVDSVQTFVNESLNYLCTSRPTAVNLFEATTRLKALCNHLATSTDAQPASVVSGVLQEIESMMQDDISDNRAIGKFGAIAMLQVTQKKRLSVLTHCNTGSLATAQYGTALGVIRSLFENDQLEHVYCTETRPYNQGARLTAYELVVENIPATLIVDSMVAISMAQGKIDAVVVGADRVVSNGDTANKIGTYQIAVLAQYHNIPFFVAAPLTSVDVFLESGKEIVIEERPEDELTHVFGQRLAAPGIAVWNPAFDVTPVSLITGIITEKGTVMRQSDASSIDMKAFVHDHQRDVMDK